MAIKKLFSERERERLGQIPDVLRYDVPDKLRVQAILIWRKILGEYSLGRYGGASIHIVQAEQNEAWDRIENRLLVGFGVLKLNSAHTASARVEATFQEANDTDALSIVEVCLNQAESFRLRHRQEIDEVITEMNARFKQHAVGYQYESGEIIRVDTTYTHDEMVKPTLFLLSHTGFEGANAEFLKAHEHYRHGRYKEAVNEALKAFESTMKCICDQRKIEYGKTDTAKALIKLMFDNGVLPSSLESHMNGCRTALEGGLPTVRNKGAGHGQGAEVVEMPEHWARHALHLAAANIVLLVDSHLA